MMIELICVDSLVYHLSEMPGFHHRSLESFGLLMQPLGITLLYTFHGLMVGEVWTSPEFLPRFGRVAKTHLVGSLARK